MDFNYYLPVNIVLEEEKSALLESSQAITAKRHLLSQEKAAQSALGCLTEFAVT